MHAIIRNHERLITTDDIIQVEFDSGLNATIGDVLLKLWKYDACNTNIASKLLSNRNRYLSKLVGYIASFCFSE